MFRYEWLIIEFIVIAVLVYELVSVRRSLRRDREAARAKANPPPPL